MGNSACPPLPASSRLPFPPPMSVNPLNSALSSYLGTVQRPGTDGARPAVDSRGQVRAPMAPSPTRVGSPSIAAPTQSSLPAAAPPGTDPELWSVLTTEERAFFAKVGAMGPLTYGRVMTANQVPTPPASRGGRLDVKV